MKQKLVDPIWQTLRDCNCFTVVVSPCVEKAEHKGQIQGEAKPFESSFKPVIESSHKRSRILQGCGVCKSMQVTGS